jgi:ubiquinol-cytochrome c reductase cytochrome c subunit
MRKLLGLAALALVLAQPAFAGDARHGRDLFVAGCSSCHGLDAKGVKGAGPSLEHAGAAAADFYLSTGRMPLDTTGDEPVRSKPAYTRAEIDDLVAYISSLGGPRIPSADPSRGSLSEGFHAFAEHCAGCHQIVGRGGVVTGGFSPQLLAATPRQVAEAVRIGPYLMPAFDEHQLDQHALDSIARYVQWTKHPDDRGGWGLFQIGPVPEGMVTWFIGALALLLVARAIGKRAGR